MPQGSTLGPLLFLLYINDLPNCLKYSTAKIYADDMSITISAQSTIEAQNIINEDLDNIKHWLLSNELSLNTTKSEYMIIASNHRLSSIVSVPLIRIGNYPLERVHSSKSLGVHIEDKLSWNIHINHVVKKISSSIGGLRCVKLFVPLKTIHKIYNTLIQPHFDYCDIVWPNINKGLADRIQKLQSLIWYSISGYTETTKLGQSVCQEVQT